MPSVVIILKIEVSDRQPLGTPYFSNPGKGPKSDKNDPPLSEEAGYRPDITQ